MRLVFVSHETLPEWLDRAAEHIAKIVEGSGGRLSESTMRAALEAGDYWLAVVDDGACRGVVICQPIIWATGLRELALMLAGEGFAGWHHLWPTLEAKARAGGFHRVSDASARPGMVPVAESYGWRRAGIVLEKDL